MDDCFYHGTAIAKKNIGELIKKDDGGIITAYLPEQDIFAIYFGKDKWFTFHENEKWLKNNFKIIFEDKHNE
jgi:hypothetical protein